MGGRWSVMAVAGCGLLALAGCATVPAEEVEIYTRAFDEARAAGHRLYDGIAPVVARSEQAAPEAAGRSGPQQPTAFISAALPGGTESGAGGDVCPEEPSGPPTPYPLCFDPGEFLPGAVPGEPPSVAARRRALDTIAAYDVVVLRLASGETAATVGADVRRLAASAGALASLFTGPGAAAAVPLAGLAGGLAGDLAAWAETLRSQQRLREALAAGAPIVHGLTDALIADSARMYAIRREDVAKRLTGWTAEATRASLTAQAIARGHAAPPAGLGEQVAQIERRLNNARDRIGGYRFLALTAVAGAAGSEPFGEGTLRDLDEQTTRVEAVAAEYAQAVAALVAYHAALGEYVAMLHQVDEALDGITAAAAAAPRTVTVSPAMLAARATEIGEQARQVRRALAEL
ncbi:MAG TPA: hypothetical protein VFG47_22240 [Geminicoccaceae bacterium]|nr:hypothetical protein [Geminicoccaceae bacterium]